MNDTLDGRSCNHDVNGPEDNYYHPGQRFYRNGTIMKLPKINKQSIQSFFLHHTEKLIIFLAVSLMGWFFWSGYKTEVFDETTPRQLLTMAEQAGEHIVAEDAWTQIKDSRLAVESLPVILNDEGIDPSELEIRIASVAVKSLAPRNDPKLLPVTDLIAKPFTAPIYLATSGNMKDVMDDLPLAVEANVEEVEDDDSRDRRRPPSTRRPPRRPRDKKEIEEVRIPGENVPLVQHHETLGLRPGSSRLSRNDRVFLLNGVAVAGVVDVKKQYADYQNSFAFGAGYYPERDHPVYQYVQVERAEVVDGKPGEWKDVSQRIHEGQSRLYPAAAPEVVAPDNYDEMLSGVIPPLTMVDYKPFSLHPKVKEREFSGFDDVDEDESGGNRDPAVNEEGLFATADNEDQVARRVGPGVSRRSLGNRRSGSRDRVRSMAQRRGSDKKPYEEVMAELEPTADHKLVRFFDLQTAPGKTYQYRVRLWLADPNNEPSDSKKRSNRGGAIDMDMMDMDMMDMDLDMDMDTGSTRPRTRGVKTDEKQEKVYKKIPITRKMVSADARARLSRAREDEDPKDSDRSIFYVSEAYGDGEGDERFEEIAVPRREKVDLDALFDLDELRFARPTEWSEPVTVTVSDASRSQVAAGDVVPSKTDRVGDFEVPDGEPAVDMAVAVWSKIYKTLVPTKQLVRRGELLNYTADAHLLNPLTWAVHKADRQKIHTNMVLVDVMGGEAVDTGRRKELMDYSLPGETLVLNSEGEFVLHNDFDDQKEYRHSLFIHDDSAEVGEAKKPKDRDRPKRGVRR